jgi:molybdenum cofactor biosynthesis enzyme MoaA
VESQYIANLTGEPFLYFELKQIAKLTLAGLSSVEIRAKTKDETLFQSATNKSMDKILSATLKRVAVLDDRLLNLLANGSLHTSKLVALIALMKTNRLFLEFIEEVYLEKVRLGEQELEPKDFRIFFNNKAEQSPKVAGWQESTIKKLSQVYSKILFEAGLINTTNKKKLTPPIIEEELLDHLKKIGDHRLIIAMTGGRH